MVQSFFDTIVSILLFIPYILSFSADPNYTVNEVWCDKKFGFVYFKDIYGQEWSRQN